jgi:hypothetical protein
MRPRRVVTLALALFAIPVVTQAQTQSPSALNQIVARIVARENQEMAVIRQYSPLVETYIQKVKRSAAASWMPDGDRYFIGRAKLAKGLELESLTLQTNNGFLGILGNLNKLFEFGTEFLPKGFLQMIYVDSGGLDQHDFHFEYVRREFLGEVRTLVFDVVPSRGARKGSFMGRIWVEDQGFTIVRFNGSYSGNRDSNSTFHFDSWRVNMGPDLWLPAFIYSEETTAQYPLGKAATYKAQTRLWGYDISADRQQEELSKILVESEKPVVDQAQQNLDLSPIGQQRAWDQQAANNMIDQLQKIGLIAPKGEVDKILDTVVNNLEITNNLNFDPAVNCRVLMTSTFESFAIGHTIVLSRGLIDVLPDEPTLAAVLAKELGYIMLGPKMDTRFAFYDRLLRFNEKQTFQHFDFSPSPEYEAEASAKAAALLKNSPYTGQLRVAAVFMAELQKRSREIPNLINPHLGSSILVKPPVPADTEDEPDANEVATLPLGSRIKVNPWNDQLQLFKGSSVGSVSERKRLAFEITPFMIYLTRQTDSTPKSPA